MTMENNEILRKIRRSMFWSRVVKIIYLLLIAGLTLGAYYYVQPYIEGMVGAYQGVTGASGQGQETAKNFPDILNFLQMIGISI